MTMMKAKMKKPISDELRRIITTSGQTRYRIAKEAGVSEAVLSKFLSDEDRAMSSVVMDKLANYFGLRIVMDKPRAKKGK